MIFLRVCLSLLKMRLHFSKNKVGIIFTILGQIMDSVSIVTWNLTGLSHFATSVTGFDDIVLKVIADFSQ